MAGRQVLVVDMLEGFARCGALASPRVGALVPRIAGFLESCTPGDLVVFIGDAHDPDDVEFRRFPPHCIRGTDEAKICPELLEAARRSGAAVHVIEKKTFSGFLGTRLDAIVADAPSDEWIVVGCVTDCCVEANVAELVYRGKRVTVVRDLVDTWDLSGDDCLRLGLPPSHAHDADAINREWFERRLPGIWGGRVVASSEV